MNYFSFLLSCMIFMTHVHNYAESLRGGFPLDKKAQGGGRGKHPFPPVSVLVQVHYVHTFWSIRLEATQLTLLMCRRLVDLSLGVWAPPPLSPASPQKGGLRSRNPRAVLLFYIKEYSKLSTISVLEHGTYLLLHLYEFVRTFNNLIIYMNVHTCCHTYIHFRQCTLSLKADRSLFTDRSKPVV